MEYRLLIFAPYVPETCNVERIFYEIFVIWVEILDYAIEFKIILLKYINDY